MGNRKENSQKDLTHPSWERPSFVGDLLQCSDSSYYTEVFYAADFLSFSRTPHRKVSRLTRRMRYVVNEDVEHL